MFLYPNLIPYFTSGYDFQSIRWFSEGVALSFAFTSTGIRLSASRTKKSISSAGLSLV